MANARIQNPPRDYKSAIDVLNSRASRKIANNTYIVRRGNTSIVVQLHDTDIVTFHDNGQVSLNSGGWRTMTTRSRIDTFLPKGFQLWTIKSQWFLLCDNGNKHLFKDNMHITKNGKIIGAGNEKELKKSTKMRESIKKYAKSYVRQLELGKIDQPSNGDCWYCSMFSKVDSAGKKGMGGASHILDHIKEKYYVPSLAFRAMEAMGASNACHDGTIALMKGGKDKEERKFYVEVALSDLSKILRRYILRELGMSY